MDRNVRRLVKNCSERSIEQLSASRTPRKIILRLYAYVHREARDITEEMYEEKAYLLSNHIQVKVACSGDFLSESTHPVQENVM